MAHPHGRHEVADEREGGTEYLPQWSLHLRDRARGQCVHGSTVRHRSGTHLAWGFFG